MFSSIEIHYSDGFITTEKQSHRLSKIIPLDIFKMLNGNYIIQLSLSCSILSQIQSTTLRNEAYDKLSRNVEKTFLADLNRFCNGNLPKTDRLSTLIYWRRHENPSSVVVSKTNNM